MAFQLLLFTFGESEKKKRTWRKISVTPKGIGNTTKETFHLSKTLHYHAFFAIMPIMVNVKILFN